MMKKIYLLLILMSFIANIAFAQDWVKMMNDKNTNFYATQKEFNSFCKHQERKENNWFRRLLGIKKEVEEEGTGWEVYKRWEYFTEQRVYPKGDRIPGDKVFTEFENYKKKINYQTKSNHREKNAGNWVPLGPTSWLTNSYNPGIGRINTVVVDPNDSLKIYIGSPSGGFWKSLDGGITWSCSTDQLATIGVSSIAIDPNNSNTIYIGTGDDEDRKSTRLN